MRCRPVNLIPAHKTKHTINPLFDQDTNAGFKLLGWLLASCILIAVDAHTALLAPLRTTLGTVVAPFHLVAHAPYRLANHIGKVAATRSALLERNAVLERELLEMQGAMTRYQALHVENTRLRELLDSTERVEDDVLIAELLAMSISPQEVVLDKGYLRQVAVGNAVIDSRGLFGQVVETTAFTSRVLLITDPAHAVPVRVLRNDVHAIAVGAGAGRVRLKDVAVSLDIVDGDELVSSGLGGRFPNGYPVAVVESVSRDPAEPFADIVAVPSALVGRSEQLLIVADDADGAAGADGADGADGAAEQDVEMLMPSAVREAGS